MCGGGFREKFGIPLVEDHGRDLQVINFSAAADTFVLSGFGFGAPPTPRAIGISRSQATQESFAAALLRGSVLAGTAACDPAGS